MLFAGSGILLALQGKQSADHALAGLLRHDHIIHISAGGSHIGIHHGFLVIVNLLLPLCLGILRIFDFLAENNIARTGGAHDRNFRVGPCQDHVCTQMLGAHADVSAAVGLAGDDGDLGHGSLAVGIEHLCPMANDAAVLLIGAGQEAGDILQR